MIEAYLETNKKGPLNIPYGPVNPHLSAVMETSLAMPLFFLFLKGLQKEFVCCGGPFIMKDRERGVLRKTILEILKKGNVHYTDLDKKVCATCHSFATTNTLKSQLHYLLNNDYITRIARGIYQMTSRGENYLVLLTS